MCLGLGGNTLPRKKEGGALYGDPLELRFHSLASKRGGTGGSLQTRTLLTTSDQALISNKQIKKGLVEFQVGGGGIILSFKVKEEKNRSKEKAICLSPNQRNNELCRTNSRGREPQKLCGWPRLSLRSFKGAEKSRSSGRVGGGKEVE